MYRLDMIAFKILRALESYQSGRICYQRACWICSKGIYSNRVCPMGSIKVALVVSSLRKGRMSRMLSRQ